MTSFLVNNDHIIMRTYENGIPYLTVPTNAILKDHPRFDSSDFSKSHVVFSLDEATWKSLVDHYQIKEPFFRNDV